MATLLSAPDTTQYDVAAIMGGLYGDGIIALKGAFPREWAQRLREDIDRLFAEGLERPGALVGRGPNRYYVEIHPERVRGFADIVTHPWVVAVCRAVLGPDYRIVEIGYDVPLPGAISNGPMSSYTSTQVRLKASEFSRRPTSVSSGAGKSRCQGWSAAPGKGMSNPIATIR